MKKIFSGIATFFLQTWTTAGIAFKRLLTQKFLSIATIAGLMVASAFIFSVPLYAEATYFRLFREEIFAGREGEMIGKPVDYAPLNFVFEYKAAGKNSPQWDDAVAVDQYLSGEALKQMGLPILQMVRRFRTDGYYMYPPDNPTTPGREPALTSANLAFVTPLQETVELVAGTYPEPSTLLTGGSIQALASETMAAEFGVQPGDYYILGAEEGNIPVEIVGLWRPLNEKAPYWDPQAGAWLLVHEDSFTGPISEIVDYELRSSRWNLVADGSSIKSSDVADLAARINAIQQNASGLLEKTTLVESPLEAMARYQASAPALTYLLFAFSVPILGLILAFTGLVSGLFVGQQRGEMAILRSRGASMFQVVGISLLQGALLGAVALAGGLALGYWISHGIGRARSFLDFSASGGMRVVITPSVIGYGLLGIGIILLIQFLIPTLSASENTIVSYKQERARFLRPPWWQRYWLDLFLLIPAAYGFWMLSNQSKKILESTEVAPDPLQNPLLLLVPALGIFAVALFTLRLVPHLMNLGNRILDRTKSVGMLMAARYLSRTPAFYTAPLILLILTLGLSAFTASLARTLDLQLKKQMYYEVGSDLNVYEMGTTMTENTPNPIFTFRAVDEHLSLPGVQAASPVGRYNATVMLPGGVAEGTFLGIDRMTFPQVAYWQKDFSKEQLGEMMNQLAAAPDGILVPEGFLKEKKLSLGDELTFGIKTGVSGVSIPRKLRIVGIFDLFPTWYPESGPLFVSNLDELFLTAGAEYPHEIWMKTDGSVDPEDIVYGVRGYSIMLDQQADQSRLVENGLNTFIKSWSSADKNIYAEQRRPERQGLFGLLSVGFIASVLLTVLGFLLYALFSFRRRFIEMGMLRAIGLSIRQMTALLAAELALLILLGVGAGTLLGVFASYLFVPYLKIGASAQAQYPPFMIQIAWPAIFQIYFLFGLLFLAALGILGALLMRMKIFQAIKLGETS